MDGDGRKDSFSIDSVDGKSWRMTANLADGVTISDSFPDGGITPRILGAADIGGDRRHEVLIRTSGETWSTGVIVTLYRNRFFVFSGSPDRDAAVGWHAHSNCCPYATEDVACLKLKGKPSLVLTSSLLVPRGDWKSNEPSSFERFIATPDSQLDRHWKRWIYRLKGGEFKLHRKDSGVLPKTAKTPHDLPLDNRMTCGTALDGP